MKKLQIQFIFILSICSLLFTSCDKDEEPTYSIINNGDGGVEEIVDTDDFTDLRVAQPIPSVQGGSYSVNMPIIFFLDDKVLLPSLENNFTVTMNGATVGGNININAGANGYAILTFVPYTQFEPNAEIIVTMTTEVKDDGGNGFSTDYSISYFTNSSVIGNFDSNSSFEVGSDGVFFEGDGTIMNGTNGCVSPTSGDNFMAISTGNMIVSEGNAIGDATSIGMCGPISRNLSSVSFDYNFLSSEFQEYVGSDFDDSVILTVFGPDGAHSEFITSVNTVATDNDDCSDFPNLPDTGDAYAGATGWTNKTVSFGSVGEPAYIIFTVTDVSDLIYSSVLAVDNISYN